MRERFLEILGNQMTAILDGKRSWNVLNFNLNNNGIGVILKMKWRRIFIYFYIKIVTQFDRFHFIVTDSLITLYLPQKAAREAERKLFGFQNSFPSTPARELQPEE